MLALLQNCAISQPTDRCETVIEYSKDHFRQFTVSTLTFKTTNYVYSWIWLFRQKVQSNQENASNVKHKNQQSCMGHFWKFLEDLFNTLRQAFNIL